MEYNYTKEYNQPIKIYSLKGIPIPFVENGLRLDHLIVAGVFLILTGLFAFFAFVKKITMVQVAFKNAWLIIILLVLVLVWTLFSLKWDNKNFFQYLWGRLKFMKHEKVQFEHGHSVPLQNVEIEYSTVKRGR